MELTALGLGVSVGIGISVFLEVFKSFDKKLVGSLTLVAISFIYLGFAIGEGKSLIYVIIANLTFTLLAYYGYKKHFIFIVIGLFLHGVWDFIYPWLGNSLVAGYDLFCITVDFILAVYFYWRLKPLN